MARSNSNQSNTPKSDATANPQDNAVVTDPQTQSTPAPNAATDNAGGADQVAAEQQKAGEAQTPPQPNGLVPPAATGAQSQAQKANEAIRTESALHNLKSKQLTRVKFTHPWQRYAPGDRAGFDPMTAAELVKRGIAEKI